MLIARYANNRNPHIAILALSLLDTLVQSCGYPFHLQISTKEFLNELVRRFPERPPPFPGPVMSKILELISGWREGICNNSRWKDDLANIRDMHRLLTFKGYRFRDMPGRQQATLEQASNIKSAEELENEDREAQSAKLQELIRRGTPRDLAAAQELMKSLAGANPEAKPDYRSQALTDLNKLEQKVILLNEMLDNADTERGEKFASGDVYDVRTHHLPILLNSLKLHTASFDDPDECTSKNTKVDIRRRGRRLRITWCVRSSFFHAVSLPFVLADTFLQINDQINTVLNRYEAFKKGDYSFSSNPIPAELGGPSAGGGLSLIDFDDSAPTNGGSGAAQPDDDLAGLFGSAPTAPSQQSSHPVPPMVNNATRPPFASQSPPGQQPHFGSIMLPGTPKGSGSAETSRVASPNYLNRGNGNGAGMGAGMSMGAMTSQTRQQQPAVSAPQPTTNQAQSKDPFADLAGLF